MRLAVAVLALAAAAAAQEERAIDHFAGVGVRAMGMGGAYAGVADDFTAVYWNPAGLAQIQKRQVYVAFLRNAKANDATLGGVPARAEVSNTRFGSLGLVYPWPVYQGSFVLAAGFNRVKDFDWALRRPRVPVRRDANGTVVGDSVSYEDAFRHEGEVAITSLAAAVDVAPTVSLGLAINWESGEDQRLDLFTDIDSEDFFEQRSWITRREYLDDYLTTRSATFGVMIRSPREEPRVRVGAAVSTGPTQTIKYRIREPDSLDVFSVIELDNGDVDRFGADERRDSYRISLPLTFALGISCTPLRQLLVSGAIHGAEWSQTSYEDTPDVDERVSSFEVQYDDILSWRVGVEWQVPWLALDLRAGYYTDPVPFVGPRDPDLTVDPVDNPKIRFPQDRRFWTLGAGLLLEEAVAADLAYTRGGYEQVEGEGAGELREDVAIDRLFLGVSYRF